MPTITFGCDEKLVAEMELAVQTIGETDRSKFIRTAVKEKIRKTVSGIKHQVSGEEVSKDANTSDL